MDVAAALNGHPALEGSEHVVPIAGLATPAEQTDDIAVQRADLERALAAAREAVDAARSRLAALEAGVKEVLRDELMASRARLEQLERAHEERMAAATAAAEREIAALADSTSMDGAA